MCLGPSLQAYGRTFSKFFQVSAQDLWFYQKKKKRFSSYFDHPRASNINSSIPDCGHHVLFLKFFCCSFYTKCPQDSRFCQVPICLSPNIFLKALEFLNTRQSIKGLRGQQWLWLWSPLNDVLLAYDLSYKSLWYCPYDENKPRLRQDGTFL